MGLACCTLCKNRYQILQSIVSEWITYMSSSPQELLNVNLVKGIKETIGSKSFMGRVAIPIRPYADRPGETVTDWFDLGRGDWANEDGTVRARSL